MRFIHPETGLLVDVVEVVEKHEAATFDGKTICIEGLKSLQTSAGQLCVPELAPYESLGDALQVNVMTHEGSIRLVRFN